MKTRIARSPRQLGLIIRAIRKERNLNQTQLGQLTGLRQPALSSIEKGEGGTKLKTLCDVLAALDLELVVRQRGKSSSQDIEAIF